MEAAAIGARLASSVVAPLIKRLFVADGPGAGLVDRPLRFSNLVSFKGEKRAITGDRSWPDGAEGARKAISRDVIGGLSARADRVRHTG
ncbi:hypothetical protein ACFYXD_06840 [Streptomyces platensis]|uniref:NACHT N-terminal Helical domain 1-containing protein n=1 Tax=Streptomyces platensis TaxID=58346 RepID=UPI0036BF3F9D